MGQPISHSLGLGMLGKVVDGEDTPSGFDLLKGAVTPTPMMAQDSRMMGFAGRTISSHTGGLVRMMGGRYG